MMRSSVVALIRCLPLLLLLTTVSACDGRVSSLPPAADIKAATESKPPPTAEIVTSAQASEDYNAQIEAWGDRVSAAGGRLCRFYQRLGMKISCPPPSTAGGPP